MLLPGAARACAAPCSDPAYPIAAGADRGRTADNRDLLHTPQYVDASPRTVFAQLLDAGCYLCSVSSFYRILRDYGAAQERRNQRTDPAYAKPELLATGVRQVWSWDISKLQGPGQVGALPPVRDPGRVQPLRGGLDAGGARVGGTREGADCHLLRTRGHRARNADTHADRGTSMRSKPVAMLLSDLGVAKSHSRPHVSDDNPYSEAQFKTLKYRPDSRSALPRSSMRVRSA